MTPTGTPWLRAWTRYARPWCSPWGRRRRRAEHPGEKRSWYQRNKEAVNARRRKRYRTGPEYRARVNAQSAKWAREHSERSNYLKARWAREHPEEAKLPRKKSKLRKLREGRA